MLHASSNDSPHFSKFLLVAITIKLIFVTFALSLTDLPPEMKVDDSQTIEEASFYFRDPGMEFPQRRPFANLITPASISPTIRTSDNPYSQKFAQEPLPSDFPLVLTHSNTGSYDHHDLLCDDSSCWSLEYSVDIDSMSSSYENEWPQGEAAVIVWDLQEPNQAEVDEEQRMVDCWFFPLQWITSCLRAIEEN